MTLTGTRGSSEPVGAGGPAQRLVLTRFLSFTSNAVAGESALDRIACGLGGKIILPMIKQHIMQMLQNRE